MDKVKIISDISLYLDLFLEKKKQTSVDLSAFSSQLGNLIGACANEYKEGNDNNIELIKTVIDRCPDEALDGLLAEYGEESLLGQMIRQKRANKYAGQQRVSAGDIQTTLEKSIAKTSACSNPFYDAVCKCIDEREYKTDADFYNKIGMPRQLFARLRDPKAFLSKKTVLWIILGLNLNYEDAVDMLSTAGYSFRKNEKKDVIISYILRNTAYDLFTVNEILCHFEEDPFC